MFLKPEDHFRGLRFGLIFRLGHSEHYGCSITLGMYSSNQKNHRTRVCRSPAPVWHGVNSNYEGQIGDTLTEITGF